MNYESYDIYGITNVKLYLILQYTVQEKAYTFAF